MIAVVGGGISGLSAAYALTKAGQPCALIEKRSRLGGVIETGTWENCVLEGGPDSFLAIKPEAQALARELGLGEELISSNDHQRSTGIWKHGRLVEMPDGLMMMIPTKIPPMIFTPLLSWGTKIRMGLDFFRGPNAEAPPERSVAEFIRSHYGQETVDYLADPLLSGVYGGTAEALSVDAVLPRFVDMERKYGSLTKGALAARRNMPKTSGDSSLFKTLKRGLGSLVAAIESKLDGVRRVTGEAEALDRSEDGRGWRLRVGTEWLTASQVILAVPAYAAGGLVRHLDPEAARLLETVDYSSSATVALGYRPGKLGQTLKGFGFLVPRVEGRTLRALTVVQNKFPNRAPEGYNLLRCFLGGAGRQAILDSPDDVLLEAVMYDLRRMLGIRAQPDHVQINRWHRGMAQYNVGHNYRMAHAQARVKTLGGIHLAGNAYSGIGIPDCIRTGQQAAAACVGAAK